MEEKAASEKKNSRRNPRPVMPYPLYRLLINRDPPSDIALGIQAKGAPDD